uniref:Peroxidase n=1 Tax=Aegilops tauschii subsp. strangulata TaxID=200361 RepID=A0A453APM1_AEGTS
QKHHLTLWYSITLVARSVMASASCLGLVVLVAMASAASAQLSSTFYDTSCPNALATIKAGVTAALNTETRMGASLVRLHFHDCFVDGCDGSVLLADTGSFIGEQGAAPNNNSIRGMNVIDNIKTQVEAVCKQTVSCADILAVAARDSVVAVSSTITTVALMHVLMKHMPVVLVSELWFGTNSAHTKQLGGPTWTVLLGRRDSTTASKTNAENDLPPPTFDLQNLTTLFGNKQLSMTDMVALSGAHTIGQSQCRFFRDRIYNETNINTTFATSLRANCPQSGGDSSLAPLDTATPNAFDNSYYTNLMSQKGLLHSDQVLFNGGGADNTVMSFATSAATFNSAFTTAMINMGNIAPKTGTQGQIRLVCSKVNS